MNAKIECKTCKICNNEKSEDQFYKRGLYYSSYCKSCESDKAKVSYHSKPNKKKYIVNKSSIKKSRLKLKYGITLNEYDSMLKSQGSRCAICKKHQSELRTELNVDHCHTTGKVRGLLCNNCNRGIGFFKDNIDNIENLLWYLIYNK
jgi:hypothetical protein